MDSCNVQYCISDEITEKQTYNSVNHSSNQSILYILCHFSYGDAYWKGALIKKKQLSRGIAYQKGALEAECQISSLWYMYTNSFPLNQHLLIHPFSLGMVTSLESTEKSSSNILVNLEMEMKVRAVKVDREIQDQMKGVEKRNKGKNQRTSMLRPKMRKK